MMDLTDPVDEIHRLSVYATKALNEDFNKLKLQVAHWQPRPCPEVVLPLPYELRTPYLDEVSIPRGWFR